MPAGDAFCAAHPEVRATGSCSRCGTFGCGACLEQRGADWLCPRCRARVSVLPWDERESLGLWRAWWRTSVQLLSSPTQTLGGAAPDAPLGSSMLYAALSTAAGFGPTLLMYAVIYIPLAQLGSKGAGFGVASAVVPVVMVAYLLFLMAMQLAGVLVLSGLDHLGLMLAGAQPKAYTVTVRAHALSMAPYLVGLVPVCGFYVFPVWSLVVRVMANLHFHRTTAGKAAGAVLLPLLLLCGGVLGISAVVLSLTLGAAR